MAEEELYDFSVSRAYYAMFYVVEALLLREGLTFSKHSAVIAAFGQRFAKTGKAPEEFHRYLIEAEDRRNAGDYDYQPGLSEGDAKLQIERAEKFIELASTLIREG